MNKNEVMTFLSKTNYLPIENSGWKGPIPIKHSKTKLENINNGSIQEIKKAKCNVNGLYIYKYRKGYLYVGQSKGKKSSISKRLYDHRREVWSSANKKWHCFFSQNDNLGELEVFWKKEDNPLRRDALEKMLTYILNPRFCKCVIECNKPKKKCNK